MPDRKVIYGLALILLLIPPSPALAGDWRGQVRDVLDGDSIVVRGKIRSYEIRLHGIDAPEWDQPYGRAAQSWVKSLVLMREVLVHPVGLDQYRRTLAVVYLSDGRCLNHELARAGLAWWYRRYAPENRTIEALEAEARKDRRGLWASPNPQPPWLYRRK